MVELYYIEYTQKKKIRAFILLLILFLNLLYYTSGVKIAKIGYNQTAKALVDRHMDENTIKITQLEDNWNSIEDLDIFCNSNFENQKIIAPENTGIYTFQVENTLKKDVLCNIEINETNKYNINIKCKLKRDGTYILGNENTWIDIKDIFVDSVAIANNKSKYVLEWYWESSNNDTEIAKLENADYKLDININSRQI